MNVLQSTYQNKKVLVTGATGFKGSWLSVWLLDLGAQVYGLANEIPTQPSHFEVAHLDEHLKYIQADIRDMGTMEKIFSEIQPDFVFHLAAQPLVRLSYKDPLLTLHSNILGTAHILEALRLTAFPCTAVMITSDKCYDNQEWTWGYREHDSLGGKDPYSASKGGAEMVIKTYAHSYFMEGQSSVKVAVGRAGNVIGGGDWALDRIVPDCMVAWSQNKIVPIRRPHATRPWQHVLEPLSGYLVLGAHLHQNKKLNAEAFNFGPPANQNHTVKALIEEMQKHWDQVQWQDVSQQSDSLYEAGLLKLCCDKALHTLQWQPTLNFHETIEMTIDWYRQYYETPEQSMLSVTKKQIDLYTRTAVKRGIRWSIE